MVPGAPGEIAGGWPFVPASRAPHLGILAFAPSPPPVLANLLQAVVCCIHYESGMNPARRRRADLAITPAAQVMTCESTNLLVIDTSTDHPVVAIMSTAGGVHVSSCLAPGRHGRDLVPRIGDQLREANLKVMDLGVVAVGLEPGSYTGLRIGLTAARTLAYTAGAVLLGFDSLEAWARTAPPQASSVHVVADAQRGDVYAADFLRDSLLEPLKLVIASRIEPLQSWSQRLDRQGFVVG